jgi:hypothetical protein
MLPCIVIQGLVAEPVTSATIVSKAWLTTHARTVDGKTVLDAGGKARAFPRADLDQPARSRRVLVGPECPAPEPHVRFWR